LTPENENSNGSPDSIPIHGICCDKVVVAANCIETKNTNLYKKIIFNSK